MPPTKLKNLNPPGNTPPPNIFYPIVQQSTPTTPNEESNRELRRINREARMKQNQLNREARQIQNKPPPIKTADDIAEKELRRINREARMKQNQINREARMKQNQENKEARKKENLIDTKPPPIPPSDLVPLIPPFNNFNTDKYVYLPPIDILKDGNDNIITTPTKPKIDNLYLIGGSLIAFLVIAMNKR